MRTSVRTRRRRRRQSGPRVDAYEASGQIVIPCEMVNLLDPIWSEIRSRAGSLSWRGKPFTAELTGKLWLESPTTLVGCGARSIERVEGSNLPAFLFFVRRAGARRADKQLLPVREGDVTAVRAVRTVLRLEAFDDDLEAGGQRVLRPAAADQRVRRSTFHLPMLHVPGRIGGIDVDPSVGVDPLHLDDRALYLDGLVHVELGRERVVRNERGGSRNEQRGTGDNAEQFRTHRISLLRRRCKDCRPEQSHDAIRGTV